MNPSTVDNIHIVAFDVPFPADYGGVIDIYYKVKALHKIGVKVHLHCYQYGREESNQLNKVCASVNYYRRKTIRNPFYGKLPYIVASRNTKELIANLTKDNYPILFEGLHCTYYLNDPRLKDRIQIVRTHNIEHDYYRKLELVEKNFFKKYFFKVEAESLEAHEEVLADASLIAAISPADTNYLSEKYGHTFYLPAFHPQERVTAQPGKGEFVLYHGNLGVGENNEAAMYLVKKVFNDMPISLVIAGNNPSSELEKAVAEHDHITLLQNQTSESILKLIKQAQINILPTFQATGIKLKLINALFAGRHCIVNNLMVKNTGLEKLCIWADDPIAMRKAVQKYWKAEFTEDEIAKRKELLADKFVNKNNAVKLMQHIEELSSVKSLV